MKMRTDHSTKMSAGKLQKHAGNNATAGNSVKTESKDQSGNKVTAVAHLPKRFLKTRTRRG